MFYIYIVYCRSNRKSVYVQRPYCDAFNLLDEPVAHGLQCVSGPRMEPVNGGTLDQGWESTSSGAKDIANRRQTQNHLKIIK